MVNRRGFLKILAAPAVVQAVNIMPVVKPKLIVPEPFIVLPAPIAQFLIDQYTKDAQRQFQNLLEQDFIKYMLLAAQELDDAQKINSQQDSTGIIDAV